MLYVEERKETNKVDSNDYFYHFIYTRNRDYVVCIVNSDNNSRNLHYELGLKGFTNYFQIKMNIVETPDKKIAKCKKIYIMKNTEIHIGKKYTENINEDYISYLTIYTKYLFKTLQKREIGINFFDSLYALASTLFEELDVKTSNKIDDEDLEDVMKCCTLENLHPVYVGLEPYTIKQILLEGETNKNCGLSSGYIYIYYPKNEYEELYKKSERFLEILERKQSNDKASAYPEDILIWRVNEKIKEYKRNEIDKDLDPKIKFYSGKFSLRYYDTSVYVDTDYNTISENIVSLMTKEHDLRKFFERENGFYNFIYGDWKKFIENNKDEIANIIINNSTLNINVKDTIKEYKEYIERALDELIKEFSF